MNTDPLRLGLAMISPTKLWQQYQERGDEADLADFALHMKHEDADGSYLQAKQLEFLQKQLGDGISGEKIDKFGSLCIGSYNSTTNKVTVEIVKGRVWSHFGYNDAGTMTLYPEEAYFLMDVGTLRVYLHGVPMSLQQAMRYFFTDGQISLNQYLVYSHLNRLGYIVRRSTDPTVRSELLKHRSKRKKSLSDDDQHLKSPKIHQETSLADDVSEKRIAAERTAVNETNSDTDHKLSDVHSNALGNTRGQTISDFHTNVLGNSNGQAIPVHTIFDYSEIIFPPEGGMRPLSSTQRPSTDGHNTEFEGTSHLSKDRHFNYFSMMNYRDTKPLSNATHWSAFKHEHRERLKKLTEERNNSSDSQYSPLVKDISATDRLSDVLDKLQLSKTVSLKSISNERKLHYHSCAMFDVYQPNPNFRKTDPGRPHHRVLVIEPDEPVPTLSDLCSHVASDDVPLYWAICDGGDISFYTRAQEAIPLDCYKTGKSERKTKRRTS